MTVLTFCKTLTLVSLAVFLGIASYFLVETTKNEKQLTAQASVVLGHADLVVLQTALTEAQIGQAFASAASDISQIRAGIIPALAQINTSLAYINQKCIPVQGQVLTLEDSKNCGTLADLSRTLQTLRGAIGTAEKAGKDFDDNEATFYKQEAALFAQGSQAFKDFDALVSSKDLATAFTQLAGASTNVNDLTGTVAKKTKEILDPGPCTGKWCGLKKAYQVIRVLEGVPEPLYYIWGLKNGQ
jgi:hypothetical protein